MDFKDDMTSKSKTYNKKKYTNKNYNRRIMSNQQIKDAMFVKLPNELPPKRVS